MAGEADPTDRGPDEKTLVAMLGAVVRSTPEGRGLDQDTAEIVLTTVSHYASEWTRDPRDPRGATLRGYLGLVTADVVDHSQPVRPEPVDG